MIYKLFIRKILFLFNAEFAHTLVCSIMKLPLMAKVLKWVFGLEHPALEKQVFGLQFRNPVGLAAGFDKDAELVLPLSDLGFGFIEIGTVTPRPQPGNDKPRLFRIVRDEALINRMGFNNKGMQIVHQNLLKTRGKVLIGGNIGRNKITPNEKAVEDYLACFNELYDAVDYFVINISSPNTPGLRQLQEKEPLHHLLRSVQTLNSQKPRRKPVLLKIAPDLNETQLDDIIDIVKTTGLDGIVATNTTISRSGLTTDENTIKQIGDGGLSGKPLTAPSTEVIRYIVQKSQGTIPVIGVGGIHSVQDAVEKLNAGAVLVQLYTGFIYEGPGLIRKIKKALINCG
jgi:dihydroorotate dehydrogenase